MMLDPLAEIRIGVFVPIRIGRSQFMMDILGDCKGRQCQQKENQA